MRVLPCVLLVVFSVTAAAAALARGPAAVDAKRLTKADAEPHNWMSYGRTYKGEHYSPLNQITTANVARLGLAWAYDIDEYRPVQATPIVVDGVMYVTGGWSKVYALDAQTGAELWRYDPEVPREWQGRDCCKAVNRGVAVWNGKVFVGTLDGRLVAIDARTGRKVWETLTIDRAWPYSITGAPRVIKGKVIIGNSGGDLGVRGYVDAYDAETGKHVWRFYTVPGNPADGFENDAMRMAAQTWHGAWWTFGGGGTVWETIVYDPDLDLMYIGVGNGSPWNRKVRSEGRGDNLFITSIVALKPDTGAYVWHYQTTPGEDWDYTATQPIILADITIDGKPRKVAMQAPKNGFFYVLDRVTGKLISAEPHAAVNWAKAIDIATGRPIEVPEARYPDGRPVRVQPGSTGGHGWYPMAFSPRTGLVYFVSSNNSQVYGDEPEWRFVRGYLSGATCSFCTPVPENPSALPIQPSANFLLAWDPVRQQQRWRERVTSSRGGVLATAGDVVFHGNGDAAFVAYAADSGKALWRFDTQNRVIAAPISYAVDGEQYVALAVGEGYASMIKGPVPYPAEVPNTNRVLAFKLGATKKLPAVDYVPRPLPPPPARPARSDPKTLATGFETYHRYCFHCHGFYAGGDKVHPDLRFSELLGDAEAWSGVIVEGARADAGMMSFHEVVTPDLAEAIRAYVIDQAIKADRADGAVEQLQ